MGLIRSAVPLRVGAAIDEATGESVDAAQVVGWLLDLVADLSADLMGRCWQPATFATLHEGVDALGRKLPPTAAVLAQRLGWIPQPPAGAHVPSRVVRLAQANVVPILKTLAYRDRLISHVVAALGEDGRLDASRLGEECQDVSAAFVRNLARQLRRVSANEGVSITQLQSVPKVPNLARLGAADAQLAHLEAAGSAGVWLRITLPITAVPAGRDDWRWYKLWCPIPSHLKSRDIHIWHLPTITMHRGGPLLRFTITETVAEPGTANATAALGVDWSPASLGAATVIAETDGQLVTDARGHTYNDRGLGQRLARLQSECECLTAKIDRLAGLAANAPEATQARLQNKIGVLRRQRTALGAKRRRINRELAFNFAKTMTAIATGSGAGVIAVEDLRDLESRGRGKANNNRAAQSARSRAYQALEHTAARAGLEVVMCPPRGTSALCPGCDRELIRPHGYRSASCPDCRINGADRDQIAGQNIAKRVLLAKNCIKRPMNKPKRITTIEHQSVTKTRQKTTSTPKQRRHKRTRHTTPRPINQPHPARQASVWDRDQQSALRKAPLHNPSPTPAALQCQQVSETDRR